MAVLTTVLSNRPSILTEVFGINNCSSVSAKTLPVRQREGEKEREEKRGKGQKPEMATNSIAGERSQLSLSAEGKFQQLASYAALINILSVPRGASFAHSWHSGQRV